MTGNAVSNAGVASHGVGAGCEKKRERWGWGERKERRVLASLKYTPYICSCKGCTTQDAMRCDGIRASSDLNTPVEARQTNYCTVLVKMY